MQCRTLAAPGRVRTTSGSLDRERGDAIGQNGKTSASAPASTVSRQTGPAESEEDPRSGWTGERGPHTPAASATALLRLVATPYPSGAEVLVADMNSDANGDFYYRGNPAQNYRYQLIYAGDAGHCAQLVPAVSVSVNPLVAIVSGTKKPKHNRAFVIGAGIGPPQAGQTVQLQRQSGGKWHTVQNGKTDKTGAVAFKVKEKSKGSYNYRADAVGNNLHNDGTSKKLAVRVS